VADSLSSLSTKDFLAFLDLALLPRPGAGEFPHAAGDQHSTNDLSCRCWDHRRCIDYLCDREGDGSAWGLAQVFVALAALISQGVNVAPAIGIHNRTYFATNVDATSRLLGIVFPFNVDGGEARARLQRRERAPLVDVAYVVLGTGGTARPLLTQVNAGRAKASGAAGAGKAEEPMLRIRFLEQFREAMEAGQLRDFVEGMYRGEM